MAEGKSKQGKQVSSAPKPMSVFRAKPVAPLKVSNDAGEVLNFYRFLHPRPDCPGQSLEEAFPELLKSPTVFVVQRWWKDDDKSFTACESAENFYDWYFQVKPEDRTYFETLYGERPRRMYYDTEIELDLARGKVPPSSHLTKEFQVKFINALIEAHVRVLGGKLTDLWVYTSNRQDPKTGLYTKLSAHVIALGYFKEWRLCKWARNVVVEVLSTMEIDGESLKDFAGKYVDNAPYSANQQWRIIGSSKYGSKRPLILETDWVYPDGSTVDQLTEFEGQFFTSLAGVFIPDCYEIDLQEAPEGSRVLELYARKGKDASGKKFSMPDYDPQDFQKAISLLEEADPGVWDVRGERGIIITLDRLCAGRCDVCDPPRVHDSDNAWVELRSNGEVHKRCFRDDRAPRGSQLLGRWYPSFEEMKVASATPETLERVKRSKKLLAEEGSKSEPAPTSARVNQEMKLKILEAKRRAKPAEEEIPEEEEEPVPKTELYRDDDTEQHSGVVFSDFNSLFRGKTLDYVQDFRDFIGETVVYESVGGDFSYHCLEKNDDGHLYWKLGKTGCLPFPGTSAVKLAGPDGYSSVKLNKLLEQYIAEDCRIVRGISFDPEYKIPDKLNLFNGFLAVPEEVDLEAIDPFFQHIREVFAPNNVPGQEWIINWMAHTVQRPGVKTRVAPVFFSEDQQVGKNTFWEWWADYVLGGQYFYEAKKMEDIVCRFNDYLANKLLVVCDEALWKGDKAGSQTFKNMITQAKQWVEVKGGGKYLINDCSNYVVLSNNRKSVNVEYGDARFAMFQISNVHKEDWDYFERLKRCYIDHGGMILRYLLERDISKFHAQAIPASEVKEALRSENMPVVLQFLKWRTTEALLTEKDFGLVEGAKELFSEFLAWGKNFNVDVRYVTAKMFGLELDNYKCVRKHTKRGEIWTMPKDEIEKL